MFNNKDIEIITTSSFRLNKISHKLNDIECNLASNVNIAFVNTHTKQYEMNKYKNCKNQLECRFVLICKLFCKLQVQNNCRGKATINISKEQSNILTITI